MNAQMRLVIMLTSVAVSGSILFAAETAPRAQKAPAPTSSAPQPSAQKAEEAKQADAKQADAKQADAATKAAEEPQTSADAKAPAAAEGQDPAPKRAASAADKAGSPQRFNPSEQVRADFDVSFPIDI